MKKIIGCILLVIPLACANPSHTDSPNHMHHTALAAPDDKQEEDSNADTISAKIARHTGFTSTGKVKAVDYADLYFSSQEGTFEQLKEKGGLFAEMIKRQEL